MEYIESIEVMKLKKLIASKEKYLATIPSDKTYSFQITQSEILFLKNDVLPILLKNTSISHQDFVKYAVSKYDKAVGIKANGILMYYPINENYTDTPKIGIANIRANQMAGTFGAIEIYVDNMDGNGCKVTPLNLQL
jgi:hypothetical protein